MIQITVHGIRQQEDANKICVWLALADLHAVFRNTSRSTPPHPVVVSVPWQEGCGLVQGEQLIEIKYTRNHQNEIRYKLVPWFRNLENQPEIQPGWRPKGIILTPINEYVDFQR